jgi:hypothetical protein
MNKKVDYSHLTVATMAACGWKHTLGARKGRSIEVRFATPLNGDEVREIPLGMLPDADQIRLGLRPLHAGKTGRDHDSSTRGKNPTGHGATPGPAKGPSPSAEKFGRGKAKDRTKGRR